MSASARMSGASALKLSSASPSGKVVAVIGPFEDRVALQFLFHIGLEFKVRQLQQLDRLLQLRGHHQTLSLTDIQAGRNRHRAGP
jgi:hypothetical protein